MAKGIRRVCIHWSGGTFKLNDLDFKAYHFTCDDKGIIRPGKFKPEDNLVNPKYGKLVTGQYAAHLGGGNTGTVGFALLGMGEYKNRQDTGKYLITQVQCEKSWDFIAKEICHKYELDPRDPDQAFTHYEFGKKNPHTTSRGKPDISFIPFEPKISANRVGDYIRNKIFWYLDRYQEELKAGRG